MSNAKKSSPVVISNAAGEVVAVKGRVSKSKPVPSVIESSVMPAAPVAPAPAPAAPESAAVKPASKGADPFRDLASNKGLLKALWSTRGDVVMASKLTDGRVLMVPVSKKFVIDTLVAADAAGPALWSFAFRKPDGAGGAALHGCVLS